MFSVVSYLALSLCLHIRDTQLCLTLVQMYSQLIQISTLEPTYTIVQGDIKYFI